MHDLAETLSPESTAPAEVAYLRRGEDAPRLPSGYFREILEILPVPVYMADPAGRIIYYNAAAVALWGCAPEPERTEWSGARKLFKPDGTPMAHDECPMAVAIRERRSVRGVETIAERPDGTRVAFLACATPLYAEDGNFAGA